MSPKRELAGHHATSLVLSVLLGAITAATLMGCSIGGGSNPDPRALDGASPDVSLEEGAAKFGFAVPKTADDVQFGLFASIDTGFELKFVAPCGDAILFVRESGFPPLRQGGEVSSLLVGKPAERDWDIDLEKARASVDEDSQTSTYRAVAVEQVDQNERCIVIVSAYT